MSHTLGTSPVELQPTPELKGWGGHDLFLADNEQSVFELLGAMSKPLPQNMAALVAETQPWVGEHHDTGSNNVQLTDEQRATNRSLYEKMGLMAEMPLPAGEYDHIVVLGGLQSANNLRLDYLWRMMHEGGVSLAEGAQISLWGGVRPIIESVEDKWVAENISAMDEQRRETSRDPWLRRGRKESVQDEADGLRLAFHRQVGDVALHRMSLKLSETDGQVPDGPLVQDWRFTFEDNPVVLINGKAVNRGGIGAARHTTESCAEQWLELYGSELPENARIAFVTSQPYGLRTTRATQNIVDKLGRPDLQLVGGGPAAHDGIRDHTFRGEVARNIYEDSKH